MITLQETFTENIANFLKTMVIHNVYVAKKIKDDYMFQYQIEELDEIYNPYYLNICGEYYPEQKKMEIISIDTGEIIKLTKQNLKDHPKTKYSYKIDNKKFNSLCKVYPENIQFITSLFYPVIEEELLPYTPDSELLMREVIAKKNYSLLSYDESLLYENERNSILNRILNLLEIIRIRYDLPEFDYEYYYSHVVISNIMGILYQGILTQRICNLRTASVMPNQIWEYLTSVGMRDYRDILNLKESMFLYRNIGYILQNKGKQQNLKYLHDNLLQGLGATLTSKMVAQNSENCLETCRPTPEILSEPYFTIDTPIGTMNTYGKETLEELIDIEYREGLEPQFSNKIVQEQTEILAKGDQTYNITKLIELQEIEYLEPYLNLHFRFILDTLLARLSYDDIDYHVEIITDDDLAILLNIKEAMALMYYCVIRMDPQTVELTINNYKPFIGKYIYYQGNLFILTEQNIGKYIGKYVDIRIPIDIPNTTYINYAFKKDLSVDMIPKYFTFLGIEYKISDYVDIEDIINQFKKIIDLDSEKNTVEYLTDKLFKLLEYFNIMYTGFDRVRHEAYYIVLHSILNHSQINFDLIPKFTKYEDWFKSYPMLNRIINSFNIRTDSNELYAEFLKVIIIAILGEPGTEVLLKSLVDKKFNKLKELLIKLCSYTIGFISVNADDFDTILHMNALMFAPFIEDHMEHYYVLLPNYKMIFEQHNLDNSLFPQPNLGNPLFYNSASWGTYNKYLDRDMIIGTDSYGDTILPNNKNIIITEED